MARLVSDAAFRGRFLGDEPAAALRIAGLPLDPAEREALTASPLDILDAYEERMDLRVARR